MDSESAQKRFEMENDIKKIDANDEIYSYDKDDQQQQLSAKPWAKE